MEKNLIDIIAKSGIVGAGGAGFPTHVKMNAKAEYVIINGAECEPLLRVDQQLMAVETKKILDALKLCMEAVDYSIRSYGKNCTRRWNSSTVWRYRFQCRDHA